MNLKNEDYSLFTNKVDLNHYKYEGKSEIKIKNFVVHLLPETDTTKNPYLICGIKHLNITQSLDKVDLLINDFLIEKNILGPKETALVCIPQVEIEILLNFKVNIELDKVITDSKNYIEEVLQEIGRASCRERVYVLV